MHPLTDAIHLQNTLFAQPTTSVGPRADGWFLLADVADSGSPLLERMLAYQRSFTPELDDKACGAYFIGQYSHVLSIALAVPFLRKSILPEFGRDELLGLLEPYAHTHEGEVVTGLRPHLRFASAIFHTCNPEHTLHPDARIVANRALLRTMLRQRLETHYAPLIAAVFAYTRLPRAAQWRLVGDSLSAVFLSCGQKLGCIDLAKEDALATLKAKGSPFRNKELHYFDLTVGDPENPQVASMTQTFRARGGCCRYYTVPGGRFCTTCVLEDPQERDRRLAERMRRSWIGPQLRAGAAAE